jgi:hypothetical protein
LQVLHAVDPSLLQLNNTELLSPSAFDKKDKEVFIEELEVPSWK